MDTENYLTVQQAAVSLNVSEGAIRKAISLERLPHVVVFGRKLITRDDLEAYRKRTQPDGDKPKGRPKKTDVMSANK